MNIEIIERLRDAARNHGEVADLLEVLAECFPCFDAGDASFKGTDEHRAYLKSVLLAHEFAAHDRRSAGKDGA